MAAADLEALFKTWLVEHRGTLMKVARAYTGSAADCQDLAQEILLQIWKSLPQFQGKASASTWFYRIALNTALTWRRDEGVRRARREPAVLISDVPANGLDSPGQSEQREVVERLYHAIRQLSKSDAALILLYLDDLTYRQMAEVLGISEVNAGVKLNRAKKALAELLRGESDDS